MPQTLGVYKTRRFPFAPARVYDTWIDPSIRVAPIVHMEAEVCVGGTVQIVIETGGVRSTMSGKYLAVEPETQLQYTWRWMHRDEETVVTVSFQEASTGCRLTLVHEGFTTPADREAHHLAWDAYLKQLDHELAARAEVG